MILQKTIRLYKVAYGDIPREIWLLAIVIFINRAGTMVIPFMTVYLTQSLHYSLANAGIVVGCAGVGGILGVYLGGRLTDKFGHYYVQFISLALGGSMFFVLMQMRSMSGLCISIFGLSLVGEAFRPANTASVAFYSTPENLTRAYTVNRLAINLGWSIGPALGGIFATIGYQYLFIADGLTNLFAALLLVLLMKNKNQKSATHAAPDSSKSLTQSAFRDGIFMRFILFTVFFSVSFMTFFSIVPVFWKTELHLNEFYIGLLLAANGILVVAIEMLLIYRIEHLRSRLTYIRWGVLFCGFTYLLFAVFQGVVWILPVAVITITMSEMLAMPFMNSFTIERSTPQNRGQYSALYAMCYSISQIIAPALGGLIAARYGFYTLWLGIVGLTLISYLGFGQLEKS
ncbi:MAG: MFS transporter [Spirosomataceae bacterium]